MDPIPGRRYKFFLGALVLVVLLVAVRGIPMYSSEGQCYTTTRVCHGVNLGGCIGFESERTNFVEKSECVIVENITRRCRQ